MKTMEKLAQSIENRFNLNENMSRDAFLNDMSVMLREALTNTLVHAYYKDDKPIKIINYNDFWEFYNPGNMRITKEEFIHGGTSKVRNSVISILFRKLGFVERAGSGGPRIFRTVDKYELRSPEINNSDIDTDIKIWKFEPMAYYQNRDDTERKVLEIILQNNYITKTIASENNISEYKFRKSIKKLIDEISKITKNIIVDFHAEATSEKIALGKYLDGDISLFYGTHTHVQTADERILNNGTGYISDVGMTGSQNGVIGTNLETIINKFLTSLPQKFEVAEGDEQLCGIEVEIDEKTGKCQKIKRINWSENEGFRS